MAHKNDYQIQKQLDKPQTWLDSPSSVATRHNPCKHGFCSRCSIGSANTIPHASAMWVRRRLPTDNRGQSDRWSKEEQAKYDAILRIVDEMVVLSKQYYNGCLLRRNDYMVNRSSRLIAYFNGNPKGGTFYTVREAKRQGLDIVNLYQSV